MIDDQFAVSLGGFDESGHGIDLGGLFDGSFLDRSFLSRGLRGGRFGGSRSGGLAAGGKRKHHDHRQKQSNELFHFVSSLFIFDGLRP